MIKNVDSSSSSSSSSSKRWIIGFNYDDTAPGFGDLSRQQLDLVSPDIPVLLYHSSLHRAYFNSAAMRCAPDLLFDGMDDPSGGHFRRLPDGKTLNGIAEETALGMIRKLAPSSRSVAHDLVNAALHAARQGVTTLYDLWSWDAVVASFYDAQQIHASAKRPPFPIRLGFYLGAPGSSADPSTMVANPWLGFLGYKFCVDGSIQLRTAALTREYHDRAGWFGEFRDHLTSRALMLEYHRRGFQLAVHNNGDAALDWTLAVLREGLDAFPRDARHRIEHAQTARRDQLKVMAELGVLANFFINHMYYYGDRHARLFLGPDRAACMDPLRSALKLGVGFALHNDSPVTPLNPLFSLWVAAARMSREGMLLGGHETISVHHALRAYTIDAAYQGFEYVHFYYCLFYYCYLFIYY